MHRELYDVYVSGDVVVVELALQGTHDGAVALASAGDPPTYGQPNERAVLRCLPPAEREDPAVRLLPVGQVILGQLGVLGLGAVLSGSPV